MIYGQSLSNVLRINQNISRIKINKNDVNLTFLLTRDVGKTYRIVYVVGILTRQQRYDPSFILSPSKIDMVSLKKAILANIFYSDLKYMNLISFTHKTAIFDFNIEKWLDDATRNLKPKTEFSRFNRVFRFKAKVPMMVLTTNSFGFSEFVIRNFKEYMDSKQKAAKWFKYLIPEELRKKVRSRVSNMFEYNYDMQWNSLTLTLKTVYILALIYAIGLMAKKMTKSDVSGEYKQRQFAKSVKSNITKFDRKKWEFFVRTGRI